MREDAGEVHVVLGAVPVGLLPERVRAYDNALGVRAVPVHSSNSSQNFIQKRMLPEVVEVFDIPLVKLRCSGRLA